MPGMEQPGMVAGVTALDWSGLKGPFQTILGFQEHLVPPHHPMSDSLVLMGESPAQSRGVAEAASRASLSWLTSQELERVEGWESWSHPTPLRAGKEKTPQRKK